MKKIILFLSAATMLLAYSCSSDISSAELSYTKATAIYGDLAEQRNQPLNEEARPISDPGKVYVSEDLLLIGEEGEGIHVYDNTNPENPSSLSFIRIPNNKEFYVKDNFIYAESLYDMLKIDISDKTNPRLQNRVENAFTQDFVNADGEALIGFEFEEVREVVEEGTNIWNEISGNNNRAFFDFEERVIPSSAVPASFAGSSDSSIGSVNRIAHSEDHVYVISNSFLTVFSDNQNLDFIQSEQVGWRMETIYPQEKELYIGTRNSVQVYDIETPTNPRFKASFDHVDSCDPVLPDGDVAYVTLRTNNTGCPGDVNALLVLDISQDNWISQLQEIEMESPFGMTKIGDILYVGEGDNGLKTFDATNGRNLSLIDHDTNVQAYDVIAHPTRSDIILIASPNGFGQYRVSDTEALSLVSMIQI